MNSAKMFKMIWRLFLSSSLQCKSPIGLGAETLDRQSSSIAKVKDSMHVSVMVSGAERRQGYGCPCSHNDDCRSGFCYRRSCADDELQGVLAVQMSHSALRQLVVATIDLQSHELHRCSSSYRCTHRRRTTTCSTRSTCQHRSR